jgi:hypothetical protein
MRRIKFLTGAPEPRSLEWNDNDLLDDFLPAIRRFLEFTHRCESRTASTFEPISSTSYPKWRSIDIEISTKVEDSILVELPESEIQSEERNNDEKSTDFLDHSFAIFEGLETGNQTHSHDDDNDVSFEDSTLGSASFLTGDITSHSNDIPDTVDISTFANDHIIQLPSHITNLQAVPKASYVQSIQPQTITINVVVGIISLAPLRTVLLRRSGRTMDILELLVGDETNAAFSITFWLQHGNECSDPFRQRLISLKPRSIIVVKNVALNVFRGKVYGQSLNRHVTRIETIVEVLGRDGQVKWKSLDACGEQLEKVKRVEKWVIEFLSAYDPPTEDSSGKGRHWKTRMDLSEELPPESQ